MGFCSKTGVRKIRKSNNTRAYGIFSDVGNLKHAYRCMYIEKELKNVLKIICISIQLLHTTTTTNNNSKVLIGIKLLY